MKKPKIDKPTAAYILALLRREAANWRRYAQEVNPTLRGTAEYHEAQARCVSHAEGIDTAIDTIRLEVL